ncbi:hypothetical protein DM860_016016 [Cuscuta australis]|uniref:GATA-type domain-containing protein n=1 Tax=Cuscuta australis TaxID=267555 RepID=A0A328DJ30_9ASTE|nr:hypothetical protein DM860_016016 [Cuscuta australis]
MMHRCSGDCPCGTYNQYQGNDSFSMFSFSMPNNNDHHHHPHHQYNNYYKPADYYEEAAAYDSYYDDQNVYSSVDCTLSLGTPSTRLGGNANERPPQDAAESRRVKPSGGRGGASGSSDPLATRRCANCDTTSTPLWRNGPRGPKSLCNACGIRFKKEEKRAAAAAEAANNGGRESMRESWPGAAHHSQMPYNNYASPAAYGNEFGYMEDDEDRDSATFLSWRLNVHYCS